MRLCLPELPVNKSKATEQIFHQFLYLVTLLELSETLTNITLDNDQIDAQIFKYITILYMYMFRAISCASSGGQIVLMQHLVSSLSVSDRPVHRLCSCLQSPVTSSLLGPNIPLNTLFSNNTGLERVERREHIV